MPFWQILPFFIVFLTQFWHNDSKLKHKSIFCVILLALLTSNFYSLDNDNMKNGFLFLLLVTFSGCFPASTTEVTEIIDNSYSTKDYYFPVEQLAEGKVYKYVIEHEGQEYLSHYWHLSSEKDENGAVFLIWIRYNTELKKDQYIKELVVNDGVITQEYQFYVLDSTTQNLKMYPNNVSQNIVFPFYPSLDSAMAYRFVCDMKLPPDFLTVKLVRDRKFKQALKHPYQGQEVDAVAFLSSDYYDIENIEGGGFWKQQKTVIEIYAKGIGLIYQEEKTAGVEGTEITKLSAILSMEEFNKLI